MHKPTTRVALELATLVCAPALLAGLSLRFLLRARVAEGSRLAAFSAHAKEQPIAAFLVLFLLFSLLCRRGFELLAKRGVIARRPLPARDRERGALRFALSVAAAAGVTLLARAVVCQPYRVLSASMLPTLEPGAWLFANKLSYGLRIPGTRKKWLARLPQRGDVIALETPPDVSDAAPQLVKRVIGLPGDRISMRGGRPLINGWAVPVCDAGLYDYVSSGEPTRGRLLVEFLGAATYLTVYVPERARFTSYAVQPGEIFVLGDNRNNSSDSRAWGGGRGAGLPLSEIDGRIARILFRLTTDGEVDVKSLLAPLGVHVPLEGPEARSLKAGIARCLSDPPRDANPPARH